MDQNSNNSSPNVTVGGGITIVILIALALLRFTAGGERQTQVHPPGRQPPVFHGGGQPAPLQHNPQTHENAAENIRQIIEATTQYAPTELEDPLSAAARHFSVTGATAIGQAASLPGTEAISAVATLAAGTSLKIHPRQVPIPLARRNNPWIKRLSPQEGAGSLARYKKLGTVVSHLQWDVAQTTEVGSAKTFEGKRAAHTKLHKAFERAQVQLGVLGSEGVDERSTQLTRKLGEIVRRLETGVYSQEAILDVIDQTLIANNELIQENMQTDVFGSIDGPARSLTRTVAALWGPDSGIKQAYQEWLMDRYGIDASKEDAQEATGL